MDTLISSYKIEVGKLVIRNAGGSIESVIADFGGAPIYKVLPLLNENRCLVLLDPGFSKEPTLENLLCIEPSGRLSWKAQLPKSHDAFVDVLYTGGAIEGHTWNGCRVEIDLITGKSREIGFSK